MASYPPWPPATASPSSHPAAYPLPPPPPAPAAAAAAAQNIALPPELQALNITPQQVAALLTHLQAGTLPFPPPPPPPPQSYNPAVPFPPVPIPPSLPLQNLVAHEQPPRTSSSSRMDIDREEGEVSDAPQEAPYSPPSASRKRKLRAPANTAYLPQSTTSQGSANMANVSGASLLQKKEVVLPFIAALHQEGFTFAEFVREGFEESLLRQVYRDLNIPIHSAASDRPPQAQEQHMKSASAEVPSPAPIQPPSLAPAKATSSSKPAELAKTAVSAKPAAPMSRQDYLARLQAAKTKKLDTAVSKQPAQPAVAATSSSAGQDTTETQPKPLIQAPPIKDAVAPPAPVQTKQSQTTELIRKKMEALKATQRRLANNTPATSSAPSVIAVSQPGSQGPTKSTSTPPATSAVSTPVLSAQGGIAGLIPGLFMSSSAKSPQQEVQPQPPLPTTRSVSTTSAAPTAASKSATPQPRSVSAASARLASRKRPVASDLNEAQAAADTRPFKRPFGKSRQNSFDEAMIIQVSDDDDTSDGDDELSSAKLATKAAEKSASLRDKNIRDLPPLRDFPQRPIFNKQQGIFTPPLGTPGISSDAEELRRKEQEITSLNLRIKEYEKRKATLRAKAQFTQSQPQTPSQETPLSEKSTRGPSSIMAQSSVIANPTTRQPESKPLSDRRTEIKAAMSARDADIVSQKARILEMQRQVAEMQKQYDEEMKKQQKLREELESLDVNTTGMTHSEMEAKKQEMDSLLETSGSDGTASANAVAEPVTESSMKNEMGQALVDRGLSETEPEVQAATQHDDSDVSMSESDSDESLHELATDTQPNETISERAQDDGLSKSSSESDEGTSMSESSSSEEGEIPDADPEDPLPAAFASSEPTPGEDGASAMSESSDSGPTEPQNKPVWLFLKNLPFTATKDDVRPIFGAFDVNKIQVPRRNNGKGRGTGHGFVRLPTSQAVAAIDQLNGTMLQHRKISIQMSRYDPAHEPSSSPEPSSSESSSGDEMDISEDSSTESEDEAEEEIGDSNSNVTSQPPVAKALENAQLSSVSGSTMSDQSTAGGDDEDEGDEGADDDRMDLESSDASTRESSPEPAGVLDSSMTYSQVKDTNEQGLADDLAPELQPSVEQQIGVSDAVNDASALDPDVNKSTFKPYESLLKKFKGYRFHPDFPKDVQGGYRSLTYSHQIDPNKELCRFEVASGVCNDHMCESQHFRDMAVSDDALLLQMGITSGNPGKTEEEQVRYKDGLRDVLQTMRNEGNLETEAVASRVAQYRRDFIQDPSNILGL